MSEPQPFVGSEESSAVAEAPLAEAAVSDDYDHQAVETAPSTPDHEPVTEPAADNPPSTWEKTAATETEAATIGRSEQPVADDDFATWDDVDAADPPRSRGWRWLLLALVIIVGLAAVAAWFLAPRDTMARLGLREASSAESPLQLMVTSQDRQKLASGNDLVSLSGRVINPTDQTLAVPPLRAELRDGGGKLVYSWTIAPPASQLSPHGSATFNAAELGVPASATSLTLRWAN